MWALTAYGLTYFVLLDRIDAYAYLYLVEPLLWGSLALIGFVGWKGLPSGRPRVSRYLVLVVLLGGAAQVSVSAMAGVAFGFARSPYSHTFPRLLGNMLFATAYLLGFEMSRAYLVTRLGGRRRALAFASVSLLYFLLQVTLGRYRLLYAGVHVVPTIAGSMVPTLAQSLAATYLALVGGPLAAIGYLGALQAFEWLSPVVPNLDWQALGLIGTTMPLAVTLTVRSLAAAPAPRAKATEEGSSLTGWIIVAAITVAFLWLNTGILGVQPTLVGSGSMSPTINVGDVVIVKKVSAEEVAVGDVVRYRREGIDVIHRVVAIEQGAEGLTFTTRGDANNTDDTPFGADAIKGKVVATIPYVGWVSIGIRQGLGWLGSLVG